MNRIILIGNGFDLAHGLKTSYADFIEWYWEQWGKRLIKEITDFLSDGLCSFKLHTTQYYSTWYHYWLQHRDPLIQWNFHEVAEIVNKTNNFVISHIKAFFSKKYVNRLKIVVGWI